MPEIILVGTKCHQDFIANLGQVKYRLNYDIQSLNYVMKIYKPDAVLIEREPEFLKKMLLMEKTCPVFILNNQTVKPPTVQDLFPSYPEVNFKIEYMLFGKSLSLEVKNVMSRAGCKLSRRAKVAIDINCLGENINLLDARKGQKIPKDIELICLVPFEGTESESIIYRSYEALIMLRKNVKIVRIPNILRKSKFIGSDLRQWVPVDYVLFYLIEAMRSNRKILEFTNGIYLTPEEACRIVENVAL